jgi:hypothetical protein
MFFRAIVRFLSLPSSLSLFLDLLSGVAEGGAEALFDDRVVERHREHAGDRELLLVRPREQVSDVLDAWADELRADESSGHAIGVDVADASIL